MGDFVYDGQGNTRMGLEGVGSYNSAATLSASDVLEVSRGTSKIMYEPKHEQISGHTTRRDGQELVLIDEDIKYSGTSRLRHFSVPGTDSTRPPSHALLVGSGAADTWDNTGSNSITYEWGESSESHDSVTLETEDAEGAHDNAIKKQITGGRHNIKLSATRGGIVTIDYEGQGAGYTHTDKGSAPASDDPPTGQVATFYKSTVTVEVVGGSPSFSGAIDAFELDLKMNPQPVKSGSNSSSLIDAVLLRALESFTSSITVQNKLLASFNPEKIRDDRSKLHISVQLNDVSDANNSITIEYWAQIDAVELTSIADGVQASKMNLKSLWADASTPGESQGYSLRITFDTTT